MITQINASLSQWVNLPGQKPQPTASEPELSVEDTRRINAVRQMVRGARPVEGTLAARYLRESRGIE